MPLPIGQPPQKAARQGSGPSPLGHFQKKLRQVHQKPFDMRQILQAVGNYSQEPQIGAFYGHQDDIGQLLTAALKKSADKADSLMLLHRLEQRLIVRGLQKNIQRQIRKAFLDGMI